MAMSISLLEQKTKKPPHVRGGGGGGDGGGDSDGRGGGEAVADAGGMRVLVAYGSEDKEMRVASFDLEMLLASMQDLRMHREGGA